MLPSAAADAQLFRCTSPSERAKRMSSSLIFYIFFVGKASGPLVEHKVVRHFSRKNKPSVVHRSRSMPVPQFRASRPCRHAVSTVGGRGAWARPSAVSEGYIIENDHGKSPSRPHFDPNAHTAPLGGIKKGRAENIYCYSAGNMLSE